MYEQQYDAEEEESSDTTMKAGAGASAVAVDQDSSNNGLQQQQQQYEKEKLKQYIKEWVQCDADISVMDKELKHVKKKKKEISQLLMKFMNHHKIDCFDIQNGSKIVYNCKEIKKPLTRKKMVEILSTYFEGNKDQVLDLQNYILEHRDTVLHESIRRK